MVVDEGDQMHDFGLPKTMDKHSSNLIHWPNITTYLQGLVVSDLQGGETGFYTGIEIIQFGV